MHGIAHNVKVFQENCSDISTETRTILVLLFVLIRPMIVPIAGQMNISPGLVRFVGRPHSLKSIWN
jgi:hypothetical protein